MTARDADDDPLGRALAQPRIPGLDAVRGFAVLSVLWDHSEVPNVVTARLFDGAVGVQIFFVLSGFLITWLLLGEIEKRGHVALGAFYRRRAARLLPAFYLYVVAGAALSIALHRPVPWGAVAAAALYVVNYYQALTGAPAHYLSHGWSLAVEEQFYLLWPVALPILRAREIGLVRALALAVALFAAVRAVEHFVLGLPDAYLYRALEARADMLLAGALLAALLRAREARAWVQRLANGWALAALLLARVGLTHLELASLDLRYGLAYLVGDLVIAALLPALVLRAAQGGVAGAVLEARPLVWIGRISYGVYLFHPLVMHPVRSLVEGRSGSAALGIAASFAAVLAVSYASFVLFEDPLRARLRGARGPA